jgi:hypothetical protein
MEILHNLDELKSIEKVDPRVSKKYVPIYSSEIAKLLEPEFKMETAVRPVPRTSLHYVDFKNKNGDKIRLYNSYDRSLALKFTLYSKDNIPVNLGVERLIHMGQRAKSFTEELQSHKEQILESVETARTLLYTLEKTKITPELAEKIKNIIFRKYYIKKGFQGVTNYSDLLIEKGISVTSYIKATVTNFIKGNFTYTISGKKHNGREQKSLFYRIEVETRIMKMIEEEFTEFLL